MIKSRCSLDPRDSEYRKSLARLTIRLFDLWNLNTEDQAILLGLATNKPSILSKYRNGKPLDDNLDLLDRAGHLLGIHKSLRMIFPNNKELAYRWVTQPNKHFNNKSPLDIMKERRFEGLLAVRRYLDFECQR